MPRHTSALLLVAALSLAATQRSLAQNADSSGQAMVAVAANAVVWAPIEVPGFPTGTKIAVIQGNPNEGGPYTLRLSFPDGYRFPAHWHPMAENLTVLEGTLQLGMGDRVDDSKLIAYHPGDFLFIPGTMPHFGGARGPTIIQLHGQGPFTINVVKPASM